MRKEKLLEKKREIISGMPWYVANQIMDDDIKLFSVPQLCALCEILQRAENHMEKSSPFYTLSALEVLQK